MIPRRIAVLPAFLLLSANRLAAQQPAPGRCEFTFKSLAAGGSPLNAVKLPSGRYNYFLGNRAEGYCPAQNITVIADSVEFYGDQRLLHLIGNVDYREPRVTLKSRRLTYWMNDEHLRAVGNVNATLPSGTSLVGPEADYYRPAQGIRLLSRMIAPRRPTIRLIEVDSAGKRSDPTTVVANTVVIDADSIVFASGRVVITRPDVVARGDSAYMDSGREFARLMRSPRIEGTGERPFVLTGGVIDLFGQSRQLDRVLSSGNAKVVSRDVTLTSDTVDMRLATGRVEHAIAWGRSRSRAVSPEYDIVADSLDVRMPGQRVREVHAVRKAFAQSIPDSTKVRSREKDWLRGDTVVARFDTLARRDTTSRPRIRELVALGNASSYYQVASRDGDLSKPAVNYVRGKYITVSFENRAVSTVTIREQATGVYLEPVETRDAAPGAAPATPARTRSP